VQGKTVVITGGTSGIGEATALALAEQGADLALICRSRERGEATRERIAQHTGRDAARIFLADMARLEDMRRVAATLRSELERIDVLLNNAGVTMLRREETADGFETTFGVNHLAPFVLTHGLMPRLLATPGARIVNVASEAHKFARFALDDLQSERRYSAMRVYGASKLCNILFTRELARRLEGSDVSVHCLHPGAVATNLGANNGGIARVLLPVLALFFRTPAQGARASIHLCSAPEIAAPSGSYFIDERPARVSQLARNDDLARRLWLESERLAGLPVGEAWC
jgi:NAD(P)-dependent dehydrogenase (short-subunit alcohol dehydrogenase family)